MQDKKNEIKEILNVLDGVDIDSLPQDKVKKISKLLEQYKYLTENYKILDFVPSEKQQLLVDAIQSRSLLESDYKYYLCWGGNGFGKCHDFNDVVLGYDGEYKKVGELNVGDILMGPDSKPRNILKTSTGEGQLYKIETDAGKDIHVNGEHILVLVDRKRKTKGRRCERRVYLNRKCNNHYEPDGDIIEMTVNDYIGLSKSRKHEMYMWSPKGIEFNNNISPKIDPYFLGIWLGDGNTSSAAITTVDEEIIRYLYKYAYKNELNIRKDAITYNFTYSKAKNNPLLDDLREGNLIGNKHIPKEYKTLNRHHRMSILAGIIDSDGSIQGNGYSVTQKSEKLIDDIIFLCKSLGFRASKSIHMKSCTNGKDKSKKPYYHTFISGELWDLPVKLPRKKIEKRILPRNPRLSKIKKISPYKNSLRYGFELDGDHRYLDINLNVNHNTCIGACITGCLALGNKICGELGLPKLGTKTDIIIGTHNTTTSKNITKYLLSKDSPCFIPKEYIERTVRIGDLIREIHLTNGARIQILTYEQKYKAWEGHNPDFVWLDEEPIDRQVFNEAYARTRGEFCEMLVTMTPSGNSQLVSDKFLNNENEEWQNKYVWSQQVYGVLDNPFLKSAIEEQLGGLDEAQKKRRIYGDFSPPEGMVYHQFTKQHVIPHFDPFTSNDIGRDAEYYVGIDPGASHAFAVSFLCKTSPYNIKSPDTWFLYDEILFDTGGVPTSEIITEVKQRINSMGKQPKFILIDSGARQVAIDFRHAGIKVIPADKRTKGAKGEDNRIAGINHMNNLFYQGKFFFSDKCKHSAKQFFNHFYKHSEGKPGADGAVKKINDDLCDSTRYPIAFVDVFRNSNTRKKMVKKGNYNTFYKVGYD